MGVQGQVQRRRQRQPVQDQIGGEGVGDGGRQCGSINNILCLRILSARVKSYTQSKREREAQMLVIII